MGYRVRLFDAFGVELEYGDPVIAYRVNKTAPSWKGGNPGPSRLVRGYLSEFGNGETIKRVKLHDGEGHNLGWFDTDKVAFADWVTDTITPVYKEDFDV